MNCSIVRQLGMLWLIALSPNWGVPQGCMSASAPRKSTARTVADSDNDDDGHFHKRAHNNAGGGGGGGGGGGSSEDYGL